MKKLMKTSGLGLFLVALLALGQNPLLAAAPSIADCLGPDALVPEDEKFCKRLLANFVLDSSTDLPQRPGISLWLPVEFQQLLPPDLEIDAAPSVEDCLGPDALVPEDEKFCQKLLRDMHIE